MSNLMISDDKSLQDLNVIHAFLSKESDWAQRIDKALVVRSIAHSVCLGAYLDGHQVGFCRIITEQATFANLVDVMVVPEQRNKGIAKKLMDAVMLHPSIQVVRRFTLATENAHGLYEK